VVNEKGLHREFGRSAPIRLFYGHLWCLAFARFSVIAPQGQRGAFVRGRPPLRPPGFLLRMEALTIAFRVLTCAEQRGAFRKCSAVASAPQRGQKIERMVQSL
jgi:hypothetical protein